MVQTLAEVELGKYSVNFVVCHKIPERSWSIRGKIILCWRCTGLYLSFITLLLLQFLGVIFGIFSNVLLNWYGKLTSFNLFTEFLLVVGLHLPFILDGSLQATTSYNSTNLRRLITGLIGGIGNYSLLLFLGSLYIVIKLNT